MIRLNNCETLYNVLSLFNRTVIVLFNYLFVVVFLCRMMPVNAFSGSAPPVAKYLREKRKKGRPNTDNDLQVGQTVSGEVKGPIDGGYIVDVKVKDSDTKFKDVVFLNRK
ncbi:unnamed protein product [Brassica rapa]|uniref:Uncharacterized protein n=2 Tax=Brassica TaxID=3705 RepID=A0A8D9GTL8_BRACM|nr:unnamed protein product [Brassica napus]CAG7886577.1 unnamed protein product [Brassica rapa]